MAFISVQPLIILWPSALNDGEITPRTKPHERYKTWLYFFAFYFFCSPSSPFSVNKVLDVRISWLLSNLPAGS